MCTTLVFGKSLDALAVNGDLIDGSGFRDTVSSIGFARGPSLAETANGMGHVCHCCHALALDECRVKFLPEYASGGVGPTGGGNVKEVWFAGSHSDM